MTQIIVLKKKDGQKRIIIIMRGIEEVTKSIEKSERKKILK
jgi:hypothetical protein